jgi:hypothetical protein
MKQVIRYDLIGSYKHGIKKHPQENTEDLGMIIHKYRGEPIGDCVFMLVSKLPTKLPEYIYLSNYKF